MTSQGSVSWYGFAKAILEEMCCGEVNQGHLARIVPISTGEYPTAAIRPRNSRLSNEKVRDVFGVVLPEWKTSLTAAMEEMQAGGGPASAEWALKKQI